MRLMLIIMILLFINGVIYSSEIIPPKVELRLDVDFARFYGSTDSIFLEVYYSFRTQSITYKREDAKYIGKLDILMELFSLDQSVQKLDWSISNEIDDTSETFRSKSLVGVKGFFLSPGEYNLLVVAVDSYNRLRKDSMGYKLQVPPFPNDRDALSDPELCSSIRQIEKDKNNIFYKNTLEVIPNPSLLFGDVLPILYYYIELYNLLLDERTNNYILQTVVVDATNREVIRHEKVKRRVHNSSVEIGTVNVSSLKGGTYTLKISLIDTVKRTAAISSKKFFVYKPNETDSFVELSSGDVISSEYALMTEDDINNEYDYLKYLINDDERRQYNALTDLDAKRKFMYEFWKRRDFDPMTKTNEFKMEYMRRIEYANTNYGAVFQKGWKTDRGRVYILYGPPDDIERYPSSYDTTPYEIWNYNSLQGGVIFIFVDQTNQGDYRLVHSNHRNELQDENWYYKVQKAK